MTKGVVGVWYGPKKDDVIYEKPLIPPLPLRQIMLIIEDVYSKPEKIIMSKYYMG